MIKPYWLAIFLIFSSVKAQKDPLENLLTNKQPVGYISFSNTPIVTEKDDFFKLHGHKLIKSKKELFVFIDGTGRLYQYSNPELTNPWTRIDSTTHFGYNIAAFPFSYQDQIFNFGGYGLWRINGQLRVYNKEEHTWDIVKLNKEIPFLFDEKNHLLWYDHLKGNIYLGYSIQRNEAIRTKEIDETILDFTVRKFDLQQKEWVELGLLNKSIRDKIQTVTTITMSPWGQLITLGDKINLVDYEHNKLLLLNINKAGYQTIFRNKIGKHFYFKDTILYYGNITDKTIDSIPFSYSDFSDTGITVFTPNAQESILNTKNLAIAILAAGIGIIIWLLLRKYKVSFQLKTDSHNKTARTLDRPINTKLFEEAELSLIKLIITNTESGRLTSIEEINKVLGITKRSPEIQKKQRSDVITSINQKYKFVYPDQSEIILKQRSEEDRRSFDYFIAFENLQSIQSLLPA